MADPMREALAELKEVIAWRDKDGRGHASIVIERRHAEAIVTALRSQPGTLAREALEREAAKYAGYSDAAVFSGKHVANILQTALALTPSHEAGTQDGKCTFPDCRCIKAPPCPHYAHSPSAPAKVGTQEPVAWRPVTDFEGLYEVSNLGNIRSVKSGSTLGKPLAGDGYAKAELWKNNQRTQTYHHRVVARAFLGEPSVERPEINHKDGNKLNNAASNLEWASRSENVRHAMYELGTNVKPVVATDDDGTEEFYPSIEAAGRSGYTAASIYGCLYGKRKKHGGKTWRFADPAAPASHATREALERAADAIDAARYAHPEHPRERPHPFSGAHKTDREYAFRLARAALAPMREDRVQAGAVAADNRTEPDSAARFVMWAMMEGCWQGCEIDGGAAQDKAVELGLIVETVYDPAVHGDGHGCDPGDQWFVPSPKLLAALSPPERRE